MYASGNGFDGAGRNMIGCQGVEMMPRSTRKLFKLAAGASLLLWLATAIAWPASYWQAVMLRPVFNGQQNRTTFVLNSGRIAVQDFQSGGANPHQPLIQWMTPQPTSILSFDRDAMHVSGLGFEWWWRLDITLGGASRKRTTTFPFFMLAIPLWFPFLLFSWPIIPLIRRRRGDLSSGVFCEQCGYDLRATPERCPECGKIRGSLGDGSPG